MLNLSKTEFKFPLSVDFQKEKENFLLEGYAAANDFDLENDIISDQALKEGEKSLKKGKFLLQHDSDREIGEILDVDFEKGKLWVKLKIDDENIIKKIKNGELEGLSVKGKIQRVEQSPQENWKVIKSLELQEVSLVKQPANTEARAIRWYVSKALVNQKTMNEEQLKKDFETLAEEDEEEIDKEKLVKIISKAFEKDTEEIKELLSQLEKDDKEYVEKSAYTDCMKEKLDEGKDFEEAAKICSEETKKTYPYRYPYMGPRMFRYRYPYRYPLQSNDEDVESPYGYPSAYSSYPSPGKSAEKTELSENCIFQVLTPEEEDSKVELSDAKTFKKEILPEGKWNYGEGIFEVTKETLKRLKENFEKKILDNVPVPITHTNDPRKNVGQVKNLELNNDKLEAEIAIKDEEVTDKIEDGLIQGISASIDPDYEDHETGESVGPTLMHTALVSEPYVKGMGDFVEMSESDDKQVIPLLNEESPNKQLEKRIMSLEEKLEDLSSEEEESESSEEASEEEAGEPEEEEESEPEAESADEGVELAEAEKKFKALLEEGRVTPAQKEMLLPLLSSEKKIELEEGKKVNFSDALYEFLEQQDQKFSLEEEGTSEPEDQPPAKNEEEDEDVEKEMEEESSFLKEKVGLDEDTVKDALKSIKDETSSDDSTPM